MHKDFLTAGIPIWTIHAPFQEANIDHNTAAGIITKTDKYDHITPALIDLYWFPGPPRIIFLALMTFKAQRGLVPSHISDLMTPYIHTDGSWSTEQRIGSKWVNLAKHYSY